MKYLFIGLVLLPVLFTITLSAPVERGGGVLHRSSLHHSHSSLHRGLSHQIHTTLAQRPTNLKFTPTGTMKNFLHVEHEALLQLEISDFRFSAMLSKLGPDNEMIHAGRFLEDDPQTVIRLPDARGVRHVTILISDSLVRALQQRGVSQETIPQYIGQNMDVSDPTTGDQYRLVPNNDLEKSAPTDSVTVTIALQLNQNFSRQFK